MRLVCGLTLWYLFRVASFFRQALCVFGITSLNEETSLPPRYSLFPTVPPRNILVIDARQAIS